MKNISEAQLAFLVRTIIFLVGSSLVTNGAIQHVMWNVGAGALLVIGGAVWGFLANQEPRKPEPKPDPEKK
jgi:hypothetical protein